MNVDVVDAVCAVAIGHNEGWKQNINLGKVNNQNFVNIPFNRLIHMIRYKAEEYGIKVIVREESYTSRQSALGKLFKNPCSQAELNKIVPFGFSLQRQKMVFFLPSK